MKALWSVRSSFQRYIPYGVPMWRLLEYIQACIYWEYTSQRSYQSPYNITDSPLLPSLPKSRPHNHFHWPRNSYQFLYYSQLFIHLMYQLNLHLLFNKTNNYSKVKMHHQIEVWLSVENPIISLLQLQKDHIISANKKTYHRYFVKPKLHFILRTLV